MGDLEFCITMSNARTITRVSECMSIVQTESVVSAALRLLDEQTSKAALLNRRV